MSQPAVPVPITTLPHFHGLNLPAYATTGAAGLDLQAAVAEPLTVKPFSRALVPTGLCIAIPAGFEAQVRPRSGLALKQGLTVANAPGTIDSDYRGEICVILLNTSDVAVVVERGMRVAQLVLAPVAQLAWLPVVALDETVRGAGGFGSTGVKG